MQNILFISEEKPAFYPELEKHYTWVPHHGKLDFEKLSTLWHQHQPLAIYSYGNGTFWQSLRIIFEVRKRWVHLEHLPAKVDVNPCVFAAMLNKTEFEKEYPLMSILTTTYNSGDKIMRPWNSLREQSYQNWEWIVWDDSEDTKTYERLLELQKLDLRMRVFRAPKHSGIIGEMKRLAAGVAYGSFLVEVDHDDELHKDMLQWTVDASKKFPDAQFFYTDSSEIYEGSFKSHSYGDFFGFGYSGHYNIWSERHNCWITSAACAPPNPTTIRHLVGLPNHVRVWRTAFYDKIGKHNPLLWVSDDYDLLVRSFLEGKWCHIRRCGYYQYRNNDGNFTFIRNGLIQHNCYHLYNMYYNQLPKMKEGSAVQQYWKFDEVEYEPIHYTYDPYPYDECVILLDPTREQISDALGPSLGKGRHIYVLGDVGAIPDIPDSWKMKITWWNLSSTDKADRIRYVKKLLDPFAKKYIMPQFDS